MLEQQAIRTRTGLPIMVLLLALPCCTTAEQEPTNLALGAIAFCVGKTFVDREGVFGHEAWTLKELDLGPPPSHFHGPAYAVLQRVGSEEQLRLPLYRDGDCADLYFRIHTHEHPRVKGELSEQYKAFLEGKGR